MTIRTGRKEQQPHSITDDAGAWDARLRAPDCTEAERACFAAWRDKDPAHRAAFERLQTIVASLRHDRSRADVRALRDEALRSISTHRRRRLWLSAAAAVLAAFGIGAALWNTSGGDWARAPLSDLTARLAGAEIYKTGVGQRSTFVLADGSSVELNSQSRINVNFSELRRSVKLVKGQALFNVAKNTQRPFVVRAGNRQIVAVGTQFDVRLDSRSVQVTLIEGKVRVEQGGVAVVLTPGKQLVAKLVVHKNPPLETNGGGNVVRDIDVAKVTGWREGQIFLEDQPLADAVLEMNRYSAMQITMEDASLARFRVNGMFRAGEQEAFATALEDYFPIAVRHRGEHEIVLTARF
jgi:transmembrane sensor